jgi:hypothetical protein
MINLSKVTSDKHMVTMFLTVDLKKCFIQKSWVFSSSVAIPDLKCQALMIH